MGLLPFLLVFASVFLHAAWNFMSKKANPSGCYYMLSSMTASSIWLTFFLTSGINYAALPFKFWLFYFISTFGETIYMLGLAYGYRHCEISLIYPAGRALPVIGVALISILFHLGKMPTAMALIGMVVITIGALLLPQTNFKDMSFKKYCNRSLLFIAMISSGTTIYTVFDSECTRILKTCEGVSPLMRGLSYIFLVEFGIVVTMFILLLFSKAERQEFKRLIRSPYPYLTGISSSSAYLLILLAMPMVSNVSYIQAFRQMSLPLGVLAGVIFLKEKMPPLKLAGVLCIMAGLLMTVF